MYDCVKPSLREAMHRVRARERLGEEDHVGMSPLHLADQPFPHRERLGVRIVHPKDAHPLRDPVVDDALQLVPQRAPVVGVEVERIDVLILLRRILGVLDAAVGSMPEPGRMLVHVRMVRRALERDVERDLDARARAPHRPVGESRLRVPSCGWIDLWPPSARRSPTGCPDRPGAATSALLRPLRLVRADRMDRRQVQHVEAHAGDFGQPRFDVAERAVRPRRCRPSAETSRTRREKPARGGSTADRQHGRDGAARAAIRVARRRATASASSSASGADGGSIARRLSRAFQSRSARASAPRARRAVSRSGDPSPTCSATSDVVADRSSAPRSWRHVRNASGHARDGVFVGADLGHVERRAPAIVAERRHLRLVPAHLAALPVQHDAAQRLVRRR